MSDNSPPGLDVPESAVAKPFWDGTREKKLVLQWCPECDRSVHYPREMCPRCMTTDLVWRELSGRGVVYAFTVQHFSAVADVPVPFVIALVDLDEGARLMSNIVGCAPTGVSVGMPVSVAWHPLADGRALPMFSK